MSKGEGRSLQQVRPALPATLHRPRGMHAASVTSDLSGERTALLAMTRLADGRSPGDVPSTGVNSVYGGSGGRAVAGMRVLAGVLTDVPRRDCVNERESE